MPWNAVLGEAARMGEEPEDLAEVQRRLEEIQRRKRGIRWGMSRHTAERAIEAIAQDAPPPEESRRVRSSKQRRRKRHKRLL